MLLKGNLVVIATRNQGKVKEFTELFGANGIRVRSLDDYSELPPIVEDGATFADNARIKAKVISAYLHVPVLADDSGLCVNALGGEPGVYSARYAGEHATDEQNNEKLLRELQKLPNLSELAAEAETSAALKPTFTSVFPPAPSVNGQAAAPKLLSAASFVCALALVDTACHETIETEASCNGYILDEPRGTGGFGYDPLFYVPEFGRTMAELTVEEKNRISHRAQALNQFFGLLTT
ncbi:non-canonical purine NTP pyrophosphatase [Paenibacillus eucommiae]|uniref:dITP/XTP pyrophosphatase n=1 Tax=Paenibacillus eucommiae TaxID=1355755 RepID=A0ABS4JAZ4_9BACL|nr:non-canonical purine NTP pyrophosphatase [Paenibacillus eucommiae]MBP1995909.1 XTP/dITP diphosphohydrolase [Paenibacillus eucommiae]